MARHKSPGPPLGSQNAIKHGGEQAVRAIQHGSGFTGLAQLAETAVRDELTVGGRYSVVVRNATRLQAAADLYWNAVAKAAETGDLHALDGYIARFGWLSASALRAWAQVKAEEPDPVALDYATEIQRLEGARDDQDQE